MEMKFLINGKDYTRFFAHRNWTLEYVPVIGQNSGVMLDGSRTEDEISLNAVLTLSLMPLSESDAAEILHEVLSTTYPRLSFPDVRKGINREMKTTRTVSPITYWGDCVGGRYWGNATITFTEADGNGGD